MRVLIVTNRYPTDADDTASPFVPHFVAALKTCGVVVDVLTPGYLRSVGRGRGGEIPRCARNDSRGGGGDGNTDSDQGLSAELDRGRSADSDRGLSADSDRGRSADSDRGRSAESGQGRSAESAQGLQPDLGRSAREEAEPEFVHRFATGAVQPIGSWSFFSPLTWLRLVRFFVTGRRLGARLCRVNSYDHILALWALPSGHFARDLARRFGVPYSVWCLGSDINVWAEKRFMRGRIARILSDAACVFADGEELCERVEEGFHVLCRYLPSFRPLPGLVPGDIPGPTDSPRFLYLGRIHEAKGVFDLLEAFEVVREEIPGAQLRYIGEGPDTAALRHLIGLRHESGAIRVAGRLDRAAIIAALRECDFVVIPTKSDSLPLVFSEAVQAGRPVVGTDVGDLGRFIRRYRVGVVTQAADVRGLFSAMLRMARGPVFSLAGCEELLARLDPNEAARIFCKTALGLRIGVEMAESSPAPAIPAPVRRS